MQSASSSDRWDASQTLFLTTGTDGGPIRAHWKVSPHLARNIVGSNNSTAVSPRTVFYLVAGVDNFAFGKKPQAWVRLYTSQELKKFEETFGIITNLDDVAGHRDSASTSCRMELPCLAVTADIQ